MNTEFSESGQPIRGWEIVWTEGMGIERRMLCMDHDRAQVYAVRYHGTVHPLVRAI